MKKSLRHGITLGLLLLTALSALISPVVKAADETAYLAPASGATLPGNSFTVSVDGHVGQSWFFWLPIGATSVQGSLTYPSQLLKVTSINTSGSAFPTGLSPSNSAGTINFSGSSSTQRMNQTVHLFSVTFQSLAPGTANVGFGSVQYNIGTASTTGGTYTINSPPPPPSPSPSPSPSSTPKPTTTPKPSATPKPTPSTSSLPTPSETPSPEETVAPTNESDGGLKISNVEVTANRQRNSVSWTLNNTSVEPIFSYGTSKTNVKSIVAATKQPDGSYKTDLKDLKLGTLYYFTIKAASSDSLQGATYNGSFTTRGYPVQLTIQQNNLLIPEAKVKIGDRNFVANKNAIVTTELSDGRFDASITLPNSTEPITVQFVVQKKPIPASGNPELQSFVLNTSTTASSQDAGSSFIPLFIVSGLVGLLGVGALVGFVLYKRRGLQSDPIPQIDGDLLTANYGPALETTGANTPEPNLETIGFSATPSIVPNTDTAFQDSNQSAAASLSVQPQVDAASLPLPPVDATMQMPADPAATPDTYIEDEQLSPAVTQVESAEKEAAYASEPSAVYDEATGELDIIHHSDNHFPSSGNSGEEIPSSEQHPKIEEAPAELPSEESDSTLLLHDSTSDAAASPPSPVVGMQ